ncbi:hypothetical protein, partial [Pseudomonas neuropathica]|uniref:hypothetical protein n=1 Tax=Pseudomonas neuropathica TaxID=2730425 RepID=UPI003F75A550
GFVIYRRTKNLEAVQFLLGHTKLESTVRYLGIEVDDALEMAEPTEVGPFIARVDASPLYRPVTASQSCLQDQGPFKSEGSLALSNLRLAYP